MSRDQGNQTFLAQVRDVSSCMSARPLSVPVRPNVFNAQRKPFAPQRCDPSSYAAWYLLQKRALRRLDSACGAALLSGRRLLASCHRAICTSSGCCIVIRASLSSASCIGIRHPRIPHTWVHTRPFPTAVVPLPLAAVAVSPSVCICAVVNRSRSSSERTFSRHCFPNGLLSCPRRLWLCPPQSLLHLHCAELDFFT
jgi:hypothetical protein